MTQYYSDPARERETFALPDVEVFYRTEAENAADGWKDGDGETMKAGWYWWSCFPGCMPDSDPFGPYKTEKEALNSARYE